MVHQSQSAVAFLFIQCYGSTKGCFAYGEINKPSNICTSRSSIRIVLDVTQRLVNHPYPDLNVAVAFKEAQVVSYGQASKVQDDEVHSRGFTTQINLGLSIEHVERLDLVFLMRCMH